MKDPTTRVDDAFRLTPDPAAYFPRAAFESALAELMEQIAAGPTCAALIGDPGLGKTLLLHVLKERLEGAFECLYVPFPRLDPAELWSWIAAALGRAGSADPRAAVVEHARRRGAEGVGLVLLVDDAGALPRETRRVLILASRSGVFSLVLAFNSENHATLDELPEAVHRIDLGPPLTLAETRAYVRARLRRADPDGAIAARLGPEQMAELHEASAGVPALLHAMLDAWLRGSAELRSQPPQARPAPTLAEEPAEAPPRQRAAHPPPRPAPANAPRRDFFRRRGTSRAPLVLAVLLVLGAAGFWRFATQRETAAPSPPERAEPERAEAAPAALEPAEAPELSEPLAPPPPPSDPTPAPLAEAVPAQSPGSVPEPEPAPAAATAPADEPPAAVALAAAPEVAPAPPAEEPAAPPPPAPQLAPPPSGPRLNVNAEPWAAIQLDGRPVGETPIGELPVAPGPHRVSATLPDGRVLEREIDARAGDVYLVFE
jgi:type II secretory pathway predicted ATPase ExeA